MWPLLAAKFRNVRSFFCSDNSSDELKQYGSHPLHSTLTSLHFFACTFPSVSLKVMFYLSPLTKSDG